MKSAMLLEFNYSNERRALLNYISSHNTPEITPIVMFNDEDNQFFFNFSNENRHFEEMQKSQSKRIILGNIYTNRRSSFTFELELITDNKANEELFDLCWREEVFEQFDEDEFRKDRVIFKVIIKSAMFIDEDDKVLESVEF